MAVINHSTNRCWQVCGERGNLLHCWWECRLVQPMWEAVWKYLKKLKIDLPFDPAISLLWIYLKEPKTRIQKNISTSMFTAVLFTISKIWKQPKCPSTDGTFTQWNFTWHKKEENFTRCDSMDGSGEHYAKWRQIPYDFTHMWNLINKLNSQAK